MNKGGPQGSPFFLPIISESQRAGNRQYLVLHQQYFLREAQWCAKCNGAKRNGAKRNGARKHNGGRAAL
jgi:hypothetical protein